MMPDSRRFSKANVLELKAMFGFSIAYYLYFSIMISDLPESAKALRRIYRAGSSIAF